MVDIDSLENFLNPASLGVGDEHLPKIILTHEFYQLLNPVVVQLIENIIKKEDRLISFFLFGVVELSQLNGDHKGLLLPLGAEFLHRIIKNTKLQVVLMDPGGSIP